VTNYSAVASLVSRPEKLKIQICTWNKLFQENGSKLHVCPAMVATNRAFRTRGWYELLTVEDDRQFLPQYVPISVQLQSADNRHVSFYPNKCRDVAATAGKQG
jgi:hypothetical protein